MVITSLSIIKNKTKVVLTADEGMINLMFVPNVNKEEHTHLLLTREETLVLREWLSTTLNVIPEGE